MIKSISPTLLNRLILIQFKDLTKSSHVLTNSYQQINTNGIPLFIFKTYYLLKKIYQELDIKTVYQTIEKNLTNLLFYQTDIDNDTMIKYYLLHVRDQVKKDAEENKLENINRDFSMLTDFLVKFKIKNPMVVIHILEFIVRILLEFE